MAVRNTISDEQERIFEKELLQALRRDPDHQFAFDSKLRVWSKRYNCELRAVSVLWDESKGDIVFVGAFMKGEPQIDMSKGYPRVKPELSIPFRECFCDLKDTPGFNETYLISKTRKAVIDKCLSYPMRLLDANGAVRRGGVELDGFGDRKVYVGGGAVGVGRVSVSDDGFRMESSDGMPLSVSKMSLLDIQRVGDYLLGINNLIREARKVFIDGKNSVLPQQSTTLSERDVREGEVAGLVRMYESGAPLPCCDAVAKTFSSSHKDVFDDRLHSVREIDRMIREFRSSGKPFGFKQNKNRENSLKLQ